MLSFTGKWMELENIILSEVSLALTHTWVQTHVFSFYSMSHLIFKHFH
jgi:hypothetical protein